MGKGFIVHPFETSDNKYHASYGNNNKTVRSFTTLKKAKAYLAKKGINEAMYDSPSGIKDVNTKVLRAKRATRSVVRRTAQPRGRTFLGLGLGIRLR